MAPGQKTEKRPAIAPGYQVGRLTVESATPARKNGYVVWNCRCACGGQIQLDTRCLQRGAVADCGCATRVKPGQRDLTGRRFGRLVCLEPTPQRGKKGETVWRCRCDCGQECLASGTQLTAGYKKSCGCLGHPPRQDQTGRRFGKLTVLAYAGKAGGVHRWRCRCDCGRETVVQERYLLNGHTKSCGCLKKTTGQTNLRVVEGTSVTLLEGAKKRTIASNTSGYNGVYQKRQSGKWVAQITLQGKTYYLGIYDRLEDAVKARRRGEEMHDKFLEWYYAEYGDKKKAAALSAAP